MAHKRYKRNSLEPVVDVGDNDATEKQARLNALSRGDDEEKKPARPRRPRAPTPMAKPAK